MKVPHHLWMDLFHIVVAGLMVAIRVLRSLADNIEAGHYGRAINAVVVLETDDDGMRIELFGAGGHNEVRITMGLLAMGQAQLAARFIHQRAGT